MGKNESLLVRVGERNFFMGNRMVAYNKLSLLVKR